EIAAVLHPAFADCPGHAHWQRDFSGAGGLFSVLFDSQYAEAQTDRFVDGLKLFRIGFSWGGVHSLAVPYRMQGMRADWTHAGQLVRLNIGLEETDDLIADLEQALRLLQSCLPFRLLPAEQSCYPVPERAPEGRQRDHQYEDQDRGRHPDDLVGERVVR